MLRTWCEDPGELLEQALLKLKLMDEDGEGPDEDQWDGYPAERGALLERFGSLEDVVVLSADIHVSIASELFSGDRAVAPEITAPSLTSQNLDEKLGVAERAEIVLESERAFVDARSSTCSGARWRATATSSATSTPSGCAPSGGTWTACSSGARASAVRRRTRSLAARRGPSARRSLS